MDSTRSRSRSLRRAKASLAVILLLAGGCTNETPEVPSARPAQTPDSPPSRRALRFGVIGAPPTLDPYHPRASDLTFALARPVYPSLFRFLPSGATEPYLASSLKERPRSVTVTLKRWRWSDGRAVTSRDVVASVRRARHPSGLAGLSAQAVDARTVRLRGGDGSWERTLATAAYILPGGRAGSAFAGPFTIADYTPGYEVVLRRNPHFWRTAQLREIKVRFVQDLDLLLMLLERRRLDAAAPPATVNLDERLEEFGLEYDRASGWEGMWLDMSRTRLDPSERDALLADIRFGEIAEAFVRDEGELRVPVRLRGPDLTVEESLIGPSGDELLALFMRAAWFQLRDDGHQIELLRVDPEILYGRWKVSSPEGIAVRRSIGAPGLYEPLGPDALELFALDSFVVWSDEVEGLEANPTLDGPLWNLEAITKR